MPELLKRLRRMDYVIIDSPPMGICPDAEALADLADASVLVVRQDYTSACDINDAADVLRGARLSFSAAFSTICAKHVTAYRAVTATKRNTDTAITDTEKPEENKRKGAQFYVGRNI